MMQFVRNDAVRERHDSLHELRDYVLMIYVIQHDLLRGLFSYVKVLFVGLSATWRSSWEMMQFVRDDAIRERWRSSWEA